jgi:hypothetical protein
MLLMRSTCLRMRTLATCRDSNVDEGMQAMSAEMPMMFKGFFKSCTMELAKRPTSCSRSASKTSRTYWSLKVRMRRLISRTRAEARRGMRSSKFEQFGAADKINGRRLLGGGAGRTRIVVQDRHFTEQIARADLGQDLGIAGADGGR